MRAGLVTKVMEHVTILVHEWFSGIKPQLLIPCPYCMESKPHTTENQPIHIQRTYASPAVMIGLTLPVQKGGTYPDVTNAFVYNFDDCVWISRTSSVVYCPAHGDIPLKYFVPDVVGSTTSIMFLYVCHMYFYVMNFFLLYVHVFLISVFRCFLVWVTT